MNPLPKHSLTIVGASTRSAAFSAIQGGIAPACFDLFADVDLRRACKTTRWRDYPERLAEVLVQSANDYWMYTGALENHPHEVAAGCNHMQLLGNGVEVVKRVRDPFWLRELVRNRPSEVDTDIALVKYPAVRHYDDPPANLRDWLDKPFASAGGNGIQRAETSAAETVGSNQQTPDHRYWQRYIAGDSFSAAFLAEQDATILLGVTRQLTGLSWLSAPPFAYCGSSYSPNDLSNRQFLALKQLGNHLAHRAGLTGLFGIDLIRHDTGKLYLLEVNPRYTASCEVIEMLLGWSLVQMHVNSCLNLQPEDRPINENVPHLTDSFNIACTSTREIRKVILYTDHDLPVPAGFAEWAIAKNDARSPTTIADIPADGELIPAGGPVCTIMTSAIKRHAADEQIEAEVADIQTRLNGAKSIDQ